MTKLTQFAMFGLLLMLLACKKEDEQPQGNCSDGFLNNGELGVDCGGTCLACEGSDNPIFFAAFNAQHVTFGNPSALYGYTIFLGASNDTLQVSLRFKNLSEPDETGQLWPFLLDGQAYVVYNGLSYNAIDTNYSVVIITENLNNRISGLFQLHLPNGKDNADTLKVINGTFIKIPY